MAVWRSHALESVFGGPLDQSGLTEAVLLRLPGQQARESEQLELKRHPYPGARPGAPLPWLNEQEFAKDVTAFANHLGGVILIGVEEQDDVAVRCQATVSDAGAQEQRLRQALVNYAAPPPRVDFVPVPAEGGGFFLAIVIPPSALAPHAVTGQSGESRRPLHYFVRDGSHVRPLAEGEVGNRYRQRVIGAQDRGERRKQVVEEGCETLRRADGVWMYLAVSPEAPVPGVLDAAAMRDAEQWWRSQYAFASPLSRTLASQGTPVAGPGRTTFTDARRLDDEDETDPRFAYLELHVDGTAFAATSVEFNTSRGQEEGVGLLALVDDLVLLTDACLSWAVRQAGSWGTAELTVGLLDAAAAPGELSKPVALVTNRIGELRRVPRTRLLRRPAVAVTSADLTATGTVQDRLVAARGTAAALLQHFGIAEPEQLTEQGAVVVGAWGEASRHQIERWAADWGVEVQGWRSAGWQ